MCGISQLGQRKQTAVALPLRKRQTRPTITRPMGRVQQKRGCRRRPNHGALPHNQRSRMQTGKARRIGRSARSASTCLGESIEEKSAVRRSKVALGMPLNADAEAPFFGSIGLDRLDDFVVHGPSDDPQALSRSGGADGLVVRAVDVRPQVPKNLRQLRVGFDADTDGGSPRCRGAARWRRRRRRP